MTGMKVIIYGSLTKHEVKMAGYWPSSFFACLWTEKESKPKTGKSETTQESRHLKHGL